MRCTNCNSSKTKRGLAFVQKTDIFRKIIWYSYDDSRFDWIQVNINSVIRMLTLNKQGNYDFLIEDFIGSKIKSHINKK